jgi:hypothetical protein
MKIKGKHTVEEICEIRCAVIEKTATKEEAAFIKEMLEANGYVVIVEENPKDPKAVEEALPTYKVGVTDITFILPVMLHIRKLKVPGTNKLLTQDIWLSLGKTQIEEQLKNT